MILLKNNYIFCLLPRNWKKNWKIIIKILYIRQHRHHMKEYRLSDPKKDRNNGKN